MYLHQTSCMSQTQKKWKYFPVLYSSESATYSTYIPFIILSTAVRPRLRWPLISFVVGHLFFFVFYAPFFLFGHVGMGLWPQFCFGHAVLFLAPIIVLRPQICLWQTKYSEYVCVNHVDTKLSVCAAVRSGAVGAVAAFQPTEAPPYPNY